MNGIKKYQELKRKYSSGIWAKRILAELSYLLEVSEAEGKKYNELLSGGIDKLYQYALEHGALTKEAVLEAEKSLQEMRGAARQYSVLLIAHAHIDMNWMWGFQETASLTVDTFRTMLKLMEEYPEFRFSQSQASVYKIVEKYCPEMLDEIRKRIKEGRWEVTASTWVENDKNMSGNEAILRQMLYAKRYLSALLDLKEEDLEIDFEPDTFGHNKNMPEILNAGGVKYYYHCRGYEAEHVYRWRAPSGAEVLVYREPVWYNDAVVEYDGLSYVPSFCKKYGVNTAMKLYGVGDHGGGPTRRQIEKFLEMQKWPLMPEIRFGTVKEFFHILEKAREQLPVVEGELNYIFTGCYTSQARIKRANMLGENRLGESEVFDAFAHMVLSDYKTASGYEAAWENILFNQFHDILPGSGVTETREYALGLFQEAMAASQINMSHALESLCRETDTTCFEKSRSFDEGAELPGDAFGAGAGFGMDIGSGVLAGYTGRGEGGKRIVTVFNPTRYERNEPVKVILWDWDGDIRHLMVKAADGAPAEYEVKRENVEFWAHRYHEIWIMCRVEGYGCRTYALEEEYPDEQEIIWAGLSTSPGPDPRLDNYTDMPVILENEKIRVSLSPDTMKLLSLIDRETGEEQIQKPTGVFRYVLENPQNKMTAWREGTYARVTDINEEGEVFLTGVSMGKLLQEADYTVKYGSFSLKVRIILRRNSPVLEYDVSIDWREFGNGQKGIPQLNFRADSCREISRYLCAVPEGITERKALAQDVPCLGFMAGRYADGKKALAMMSDSRYGFRGYENSVQLTLLRSSYDPDETPDIGKHEVRFGIGILSAASADLFREYSTFIHPVYACAHGIHSGILPADGSFLDIRGDVNVTGIKRAEDGNGFIIRLCNPSGICVRAELVLKAAAVRAEKCSVMEKRTADLTVEENKVYADIGPHAVQSIRVVVQPTKQELRR